MDDEPAADDEHAGDATSSAPPATEPSRHVVELPFGFRRVATRDVAMMGGVWISVQPDDALPWEEERIGSYLVSVDPGGAYGPPTHTPFARRTRIYMGRFAEPTGPKYGMGWVHDSAIRLASQEEIDDRIRLATERISKEGTPKPFNPDTSIKNAFLMGLVALGVMGMTGYLWKGGAFVALGVAVIALVALLISDYVSYRSKSAAFTLQAALLTGLLDEIPRTPQVSARALRWREQFGQNLQNVSQIGCL